MNRPHEKLVTTTEILLGKILKTIYILILLIDTLKMSYHTTQFDDIENSMILPLFTPFRPTEG